MYEVLLQELKNRNITLIAVSKTHSAARIQALYDLGQRDFGENRVQELVEKAAVLPADIRWHLIGHLQTNKVKYIAPFVHLIHAIDSIRLLREVDKQGEKAGRVITVLLQFHIAREATKFGLELPEAEALLEELAQKPAPHVRIAGVMGMASLSDDQAVIKKEFAELSEIFQRLKTRFFAHDPGFRELSMGMSSDWQLAAEAGSTMVRIGSLLFGERDYSE